MMSCRNKWHRKWLHANQPVKLLLQKTIASFCVSSATTSWFETKNNTRGCGRARCRILSQFETKLFVGGFQAVGLALCMCRAVTVLQMVFPHVLFIMLCTVVTFGWDRPVYFQPPATVGTVWSQGCHGSADMTFKGWEQVCRPCRRKWAAPMRSVCYGRSNRPPGTLSVPTVSIRDWYQNQCTTASQANLRLTKSNGM